jgi:osmoprotectant transport system permease protein
MASYKKPARISVSGASSSGDGINRESDFGSHGKSLLTDATRHKSVALAGALVVLFSMAFGWLTVRPNRLASGTSLHLWDSLGWGPAAAIIVLSAACLVAIWLGTKKIHIILQGVLANLVLILTFIFAGSAASRIINSSPEFTRVSIGAGIWVIAIGAVIIIVAVRQRLPGLRLPINVITWTWLAVILMFLGTGWFNNVSVVQEYLNNTSRFRQELTTHLYLFGGSIAAGIVIGIPLGIWAARSRRANRPIFILANITQTIPSLALFGLLIAPLSALSSAFPVLRQLGIEGIGAAPALIALIIYSLLPIIRNTYIGLHQINPAVIDAGRGMGMNRSQLLRRIELPLAVPVILDGVRTAAVQTVGNTAVAALIGAGGLGQFIFQGLGQAASDLIILGAVPIIVMALIIDSIMQVIIWAATPRGLVREKA